jgi:hypothetical protein
VAGIWSAPAEGVFDRRRRLGLGRLYGIINRCEALLPASEPQATAHPKRCRHPSGVWPPHSTPGLLIDRPLALSDCGERSPLSGRPDRLTTSGSPSARSDGKKRQSLAALQTGALALTFALPAFALTSGEHATGTFSPGTSSSPQALASPSLSGGGEVVLNNSSDSMITGSTGGTPVQAHEWSIAPCREALATACSARARFAPDHGVWHGGPPG